MAERTRSHDWAETPLGPIEGWSARLKMAVEMVLASPLVSYVVCTHQRLLIYNDAAAAMLGPMHPRALGQSAPKVLTGAKDTMGPLFDRAFAGEAIRLQTQPIDLHAAGFTRSFDLLLTPIREEDGTVAYVQGIGFDVSARVAAEAQRDRTLQDLRASQEQQAFLLSLSDALRPLSEPADIAKVVTCRLCKWLAVNRVCYGEIEGGTLRILHDHTSGVSSIVGEYSLMSFDEAVLANYGFGKVVTVNDVSTDKRLNNTTKSELRGRTIAAFADVVLLENERCASILAVQHATPRVWTEAERSLILDVSERVRTAVERVRIEAALRESEGLFRSFAENTTDVLWIVDAESQRLEYLNPAFEVVWGETRTRVVSDLAHWVSLVHPDDREQAVQGMPRVLAGEAYQQTYRIVRPSDGSTRYIQDTGFPIWHENGRIRRVAGIAQDVTRQKQAEDQIRESEGRLRTLMEGVPQLVWRARDGGLWTWASPQWHSFTGQSQQESAGHGWLDAVHPDDRERTLQAWNEARLQSKLDIEFRVRRACDGAYLWHRTRSLPQRDARNTIVEWLGTTTDINDLYVLQERQAVLVNELQHRTRNLITVVRSIAQQTMARTGPTERFRTQFNDRLSALSRVQGLLSRSEQEPITLRALIQIELDALGAAAMADRIALTGPLIALHKATVQTLALALHELATNARKHGALTSAHGRLSIAWRAYEAEDGSRLTLEWLEEGISGPREPPSSTSGGYGRELIERALPYALDARTSYELTELQLRCMIDLPLTEPAG